MIEQLIKDIHSGDAEQLDAIFSDKQNILVEAPAGYGKTKTMISRIAYLIASDKVPKPKKILALTFSVNAAYKIKQEVAEKLPEILAAGKLSPNDIKHRVIATNYHGFCRRILGLYGYLLDPHLKKINHLIGIGDDNPTTLTKLNVGLPAGQANKMASFNTAVKQIDIKYLKDHKAEYLKSVSEYLLPNNYITFNSILLFAIELLIKHKPIEEFYKKYFSAVIIDEFQDTNILSWALLIKLIGQKTKAMFIGDSLQRIYGFIGAMPDLLNKAQTKYDAYKVELKKNYRFQYNLPLLQLDKNIRENARNPRHPLISSPANAILHQWSNQAEEAAGVCEIVHSLLTLESTAKIAVLVKMRGANTTQILNAFDAKGLNYFYALYSDEDAEYVEFHYQCLKEFLIILSESKQRFNKIISNKFAERIKNAHKGSETEISKSLLKLLATFLDKIFSNYAFLTSEEKIEFIKDTFESRALKQYLSHVDSNIIISTVHGAKGLEWDYVILPDMEQFSFPNWPALCGLDCQFKKHCRILWDEVPFGCAYEKSFLDELSVFYVAATRAKKQLIFSYSQIGLAYTGKERQNNLSCLLQLDGVEYSVKDHTIQNSPRSA